MGKPVVVTIELTEEDVERIESFRTGHIRMNLVHGTRETTEEMRQMPFDKLTRICLQTILRSRY